MHRHNDACRTTRKVDPRPGTATHGPSVFQRDTDGPSVCLFEGLRAVGGMVLAGWGAAENGGDPAEVLHWPFGPPPAHTPAPPVPPRAPRKCDAPRARR